jgi:hypothetical protein
MTKILKEGLDYHDMVDQLDDTITVDEYAAKMGKDSDIVTITFVVHSKSAAQDLVQWLEVGYDWILDASVSQGEIEPGKWLVFAETNRRTSTPERICEILEDLETLTDRKLKDWTIEVNDEEYDADPEILKQVMTLSPHEYKAKVEKEKELNEYRTRANLPTKKLYEDDEYIRNLKSIARI